MAFANRFHFRFDSIHGVEYNIYILQDGYSGECENRKLGRAPVLRKQKNGPVCGTSLDLYAECAPGHDGEFAALFTSNPKEYRVDVKRKVSGTDVLIWQGFVSTELYSEPSIYPPYDVQIVATDGLGELKLVDFIPVGIATLSQHFRTALAYTGMNRTIYVASSLVMTGEGATDTFEMSINLDYMEGDSYYDVVTKLLDTLHSTITMYGDKWLIARETDLPALLSGSGLSVVSIAADGTVSTTTIGGVHKTVGSMADNSVDTWPVGQLSTAINPARKEVTVEAPWHTVSGPDDPNMEKTTGSPWNTEGIVRHDTTDDCFYELGLDPNNPQSDDTWGTIKQEIPINKLDCGFQLKLRVAPRVYKLRVGDAQWYAHGNIKVHLEYDCYISSGSHSTQHTSTYIGTEEGWSGAPQHESDPKVEIPTTDLDSIGERWLSINIPAISTPDSASRYIVADYATIRIVIEGHWVEVYECILTPSLDLPGYRDIIHLDNDAVGAAETVEITGGRVRADNLVNSKFYGGIWIFNGAIVTSFADSVHSNGDFLSITALSYALSVAGRRLKTEGKLNIPADFSVIPLFITFEEIISWIETWEWDLIQEEAQVSAISLPAVEVQVESETIDALPEGGSGGSGGTGNGSSASSAYSYKNGGSSFFEEDGDGNIKLKDEYGGLWTKGFLTAGGVGQSSGGGGGGGDVDLPRVWKSLQNQDTINTYNDYKFSTAHLPTLGAGLAYTDNHGSGASLATTLGIASGYKLPTTEEWANVADNLNSLQALQAQVDSLSTRDNFDELTASALFADVLAASDGYFGAIYGPLHGNADTATSATSAGSSTTASYLVSSSYSEGSGKNPVYFSGGRPVASSSSEGSASLPVYLSSGYLTACTASSLFSSLSSTAATNLSVTVAGQNRTATLYATYDTASENIASNFSTVGAALKSLQSQIDSVATRNGFDELTATTVFADILAATNIYGALHGNADTATYATSASYATYDSASENIASNFTTVGTALKSLQSQIDSVAANRAFDELTVTAGYFDMLSVGANLNVAGTIYSIKGIYSSGYVTAGAVGSSSDARLKNDIETISAKRAADVIMALRPCEWVWNEKHSSLEGRSSAGLIAQEVRDILPDMVYEVDGELSLLHNVLHGYQISMLQDHETRIEELEKEVAALRKENTELKSRITA